ncbi:LuxR family transcriptional regulator [Mycobacterium sp. IS-1742]|uniref:response regulator transcription factor n=1 Tax=Mycobacterium sp. IS-1742 TaxID=1772285 RepID=UPI000740270A|nr:response regulator transcription factor [Mycobacterium sp. IS-1742]KUI29137.1 LuxR family transcriptional regulator [Mycobacterium sp. IS-1742]
MPASPEGHGESAVSIAVVDRQAVVHAGIEHWLIGSVPPIKIIGHFAHPTEFIAAYPEADPTVDVVLLALKYDDHAPDFASLRTICSRGHRVIVYSYLATDEVILTCLDLGALTFVAKSESGSHLRDAIYAARSATPYVPPRMAAALLHDRTGGRPHLTERERQVLVAWFLTENKDVVGQRLFIEPSTVRTHLQRVRAKYAAIGRPAPTKAALIARAIQDGILSADDL